MSTDTNETIYERAKAYEDMDDDDRAFAIHSARYILEDVSMEKMAEISGLPLGVITAAFDNIFIDKDTVRVKAPKGQRRPSRRR
jgi:hypothetical protein